MTKRNLKADLETCNKATPGPYIAGRSDMATVVDGVLSKWIYAGKDPKKLKYIAIASGLDIPDWEQVMANAHFFAEAREGWPYAIEQALAEKERADKYEVLVRGLVRTLLLYEKWEADVITNDKVWYHKADITGLPLITQELWNELVEIQLARNKVVVEAKEMLNDKNSLVD